MPSPERFLTIRSGDEIVEVIKTYDEAYAREVFRSMDDKALSSLADSLKFEALYEPDDIPRPGEEGYEAFVWDVMAEEAREDYNRSSYFVVTRAVGLRRDGLFISPDWPTAEAYVKRMGLPDTAKIEKPA